MVEITRRKGCQLLAGDTTPQPLNPRHSRPRHLVYIDSDTSMRYQVAKTMSSCFNILRHLHEVTADPCRDPSYCQW